MLSILRPSILLVLAICSHSVFAATYYISANGSDSNNGTSNTSPWLHAPGMTGCSSNCQNKAYGQNGFNIPSPGDRFILRGGDTWYWTGNGAADGVSHAVGLPWVFGWDPVHSAVWDGSSSSHIYIGVDHTWWNSAVCGSAWCRPIMDGGNPVSTAPVARCKPTGAFLAIDSWKYGDLDDLEFTGLCDDGSQNAYGALAYLIHNGGGQRADYRNITNLYFHGVTTTNTSAATNGYAAIGSSYDTAATNDFFIGDVCDNSDGSSTVLICFFQGTANVSQSVFRNAWQGIVTNNALDIHDNLFELIHNPSPGSGHANAMEWNTGYPGRPHYFYNNVVRNIDAAVTLWTCAETGQTDSYFNNVVFSTTGWAIANANYNNAGNACASSTGTSAFFSNTLVGLSGTGSYAPWNSNLQNNFLIDSSWRDNVSSPINEIDTTSATASAFGFTSGNNYMPTSSDCNGNASASGCPIGKGGNLTSVCGAISDANAKSACLLDTTLGPAYDSVHHRVTGTVRTPTARPASGSWDVGAFQYSSTGSVVLPPVNVTAVAK